MRYLCKFVFMKKGLSYLLAVCLILLSQPSNADSPVTSTPFYTAYMDIPIVKMAADTSYLNADIIDFLLAKNNPIDHKMAVINAIGWDFNGKNNAELFMAALVRKYNPDNTGAINWRTFSAGELLCLGYLTVMDNYFEPKNALPYLELAVKKEPQSFTFNIILAIVKAQAELDRDWCMVWKVTDKVFSNSKLKKDLRDEASKIIFDYLVLYKESCND